MMEVQSPYARKKLKIVVISDTHNYQPALPEGDILIHCGDFTSGGSQEEIHAFLRYIDKQPHRHKIVIAGNHDLALDPIVSARLKIPQKMNQELIALMKNHCIYLQHEIAIVQGLRIFGSPYTPEFYDWAFMTTTKQAQKLWQPNPDFQNLDILVTHGPPFGVLDQVEGGIFTGCQSLINLVQTVHPKHHVFGHIHQGYGNLKTEKTHFWNCSVLNEKYNLAHKPTVFQI